MAPETSPVEELESLRMLGDDFRFYGWTFVKEGTHSEVYRATELDSGDQYCIKVYKPGDMLPFEQPMNYWQGLTSGIIYRKPSGIGTES